MWETITIIELWEYMMPPDQKIFRKPSLPTRRWGKVYSKESTTDKRAIEKCLEKYKLDGTKVRKRIHHEDTAKWKKWGTMYKIERFVKTKNPL